MGAAFVPALLALADPAQTRVTAIMADLEAAFPHAGGGTDDDDEGGDRPGGERNGVDKRRPSEKRRGAKSSGRKPAARSNGPGGRLAGAPR